MNSGQANFHSKNLGPFLVPGLGFFILTNADLILRVAFLNSANANLILGAIFLNSTNVGLIPGAGVSSVGNQRVYIHIPRLRTGK